MSSKRPRERWKHSSRSNPDHYFLRNNLQNLYGALGRERDLAWMALRIADARPWSVRVNFEVANQLLRQGNVDGAWQYGARAESALSPGSAAAEPDLAVSVRLFRAYVAWLQDDPDEMLRLLDRAAASVEELAGGERRQVLRRLWTMYAAAGRLRQAEQAIESAHTYDPGDFVYALNTDLARAELFVERGDLSGLRAFAAARWKDPLPDAAPPFVARRLTFLIDAGWMPPSATWNGSSVGARRCRLFPSRRKPRNFNLSMRATSRPWRSHGSAPMPRSCCFGRRCPRSAKGHPWCSVPVARKVSTLR